MRFLSRMKLHVTGRRDVAAAVPVLDDDVDLAEFPARARDLSPRAASDGGKVTREWRVRLPSVAVLNEAGLHQV